MSEYRLYIGPGSPTPEYEVLKDAFELNLQANWQSTLACDIVLATTDPRLVARAEITLTKDGSPWFGGVITQTPEQGFGGPNLDQIVHHITAVGYETYLTYRSVTETIPAGTTLKAALQILDDYLPTGVVLDPAQATGPTLTVDYVFTRTRLDACCAALTSETGYLARIGPDKLFGMYAPTTPAPFDILDTGPTGSSATSLYQIGDLRVERTLDDNYANRVVGEIRGAGPATSTESFVAADGVTGGGEIRFTAKYPASQSINDTYPNILYIDGVVQCPIGWGPTQLPVGIDWYWDFAATPTAQLVYPIAGARPFPVGAEVVTITYAIGLPFYVVGNDTADQASHPIKEALVSIDEAMTLEAAQAYVDAEATRRASTIERALYTTEETTLVPGMIQTITHADRDINASCLITECRFYSSPERPGEELLCDVTAVAGTAEAGNVRTTYKEWLQQGGTGAAKTGVSGGAVAPPLRAVQFNDGGAFGGSADVLIDKDGSGDEYATGIAGAPSGPARLAVVIPEYGDNQLALANRTAGLEKALVFDQLDDGTQYIEHRGDGLFMIEHLGDWGATAGGDVYLTTGESTSAAIKLRGLVTLEGLCTEIGTITSTPFTIDTGVSGGNNPITTFLLDRSGGGTLNFPALSAFNVNPITTQRRMIFTKNIGSGDWVLDANSSEVFVTNTGTATTVTLKPGQGILWQAKSTGWYALASHGLPEVPPGSDTQVLFNDGGVQGADAGLAFDKTTGSVIGTRAASPGGDGKDVLVVRETAAAASPGNPRGYVTADAGNGNGQQVAFGMRDYVAKDAQPTYLGHYSGGTPYDGAILEVLTDEVIGDPVAYSKGIGIGIHSDTSSTTADRNQAQVYEYGGLGTGAKRGMGLKISRNSSGSGAAGYLALEDSAGTPYFLWVEGGKLRIHTAPPTEDNTTVAHTAGVVVGSQS